MSTQKVYASYEEIIDLHTESDRVSVLGIHTPTTDTPHKMFSGFFKQFKKVKYYGCSIKLVPAARLPADPLQVSYEAGEPTIDPRDLLNPLLVHGCHGNDLGAILNKLYTVGTVGRQSGSSNIDIMESDSMIEMDSLDLNILNSPNMLESLYYRALTDNSWKKAHPQRGFKKSGLTPLVYDLAVNTQVMPGTWSTGFGPDGQDIIGGNASGYVGTAGLPTEAYGVNTSGTTRITRSAATKAIQFMTPRLTRLGWMDTYNVGGAQAANAAFTPSTAAEKLMQITNTTSMAKLPTCFMLVVLLPPAYKTEQYFRAIITHHWGFAQFRGISYDPSYEIGPYFNWNDPNFSFGDTPSLGDPEPDEPEVEFAAKYTIKEISADGHTITISDGTQWVDMEANVPTGTVTPSITPAADTPFTLSTNATKKISCQFTANSGVVTCIWYPTLAHWSIGGTTNSSTSFDTFGTMFTESGDNSDLAEYLNGVIENGTVATFYDGE